MRFSKISDMDLHLKKSAKDQKAAKNRAAV
jgi:hypothetical protein